MGHNDKVSIEKNQKCYALEHSVNNDKYKAPKGKKQTHNVLITNMGTASECPERKAGFCQLKRETDCYAWRAEKRFEKCKAYRERQGKQFEEHTIQWYVDEITGIQARKRAKLTHHRWNESGGLRDEHDLATIAVLANDTKKLGIETFTYTSRQDIWEKIGHKVTDNSEIVVNGSGFMAHNEYRVVPKDYQKKENEYWCPDKCYNCSMCKKRLGITILAKERKAGEKAKRHENQ